MKKIIYILLAVGVVSVIIASCKKSGSAVNPLSDVSNLGVGAYLKLDANTNLNFNSTALATSTVGIKVTQAASGQPVDHIDLYVSSNGSYDVTTWHKIKTIPYTGAQTAITATGTEMATALGKTLGSFAPGTSYVFYTRTFTTTGASFDVNNTGNNSGSGLVTGVTYNTAFSFTAFITCPFTGGMTGTYTVLRDDWVDWSPGDLVQVTDGPGANQINLSQVYPGLPDGGVPLGPLVVNIDPATGAATVPKVDVGTYGGSTHYTVQGAGANFGAGYVFSCTGYITVQLTWYTLSGALQGTFTLQLQKKS